MSEEYALPLNKMPTDIRPATTRHSIIDLTVKTTAAPVQPLSIPTDRPPARWKTLEFRIYILIALIIVPLMIWIGISASSPSRPNFPRYQSRLSQGWLFGRQVDNSDHQYRSFRGNIGALVLLASAFLGSKAAYAFTQRQTNSPDNMHFLPFNFVFSILVLIGLHGSSALKVLAILTVNYAIAKILGSARAAPIATWVFNGTMLLANDWYSGYKFGDIWPALASLDDYSGFYPRWHISFNITMLRLISFSMDYYWACQHTGPFEAGRELDEKQRAKLVHPKAMYSYRNYVSYAIYSPLYIAGPIMTFNDYIWQHRRPTLITFRSNLGYLTRLAFSIFTMEFVLHYMYVVAIKDTKAWQGGIGGALYSPAEISMIGFWNLLIVWLKLLIPWRFFRAWALLDGIDPPENMIRCVANNYSTLGFWRSWHRSYNLWIIRYIYVPLGGANRTALNTLLVFSFVALWHDLTFKLLAWGWLVSLFVIPELIAVRLLPAKKYGKFWWYRHICAAGGVLNILMMFFANLIGFVLGTDGAMFFVGGLFGSVQGFYFMAFAVACVFVGIHLMFEYREEEMRRGIFRRC